MKMNPTSRDKEEKVKYTIVLPKTMLSELKRLSQNKLIPSISQGIQGAIDTLLQTKKKEQYLQQMQEASKDNNFLKRTHDTQSAFENSDVEIDNSW
jgi:metal-responsive CopG/Arc/MetJ family transcriptional regulator